MTRAILCGLVLVVSAAGTETPPRPALEDAVVAEPHADATPQVSTAELHALIDGGTAVLIDARPPAEYAMSHIPSAINVAQKPGTSMQQYVSDVAEVRRRVPDAGRTLVLYCNGPFCGKSRRLARDLLAAGYRDVRRYQIGMPGWRTTGGVAVIEVDRMRDVARLDRTAVFVDAGLPAQRGGRAFAGRPLARIPADDVDAAKDDGRLPINDHNTRIVVIGDTPAQANAVAARIAANAFHNVAMYAGNGGVLLGGQE
jgi:rhodanese-related sulfurtransferase